MRVNPRLLAVPIAEVLSMWIKSFISKPHDLKSSRTYKPSDADAVPAMYSASPELCEITFCVRAVALIRNPPTKTTVEEILFLLALHAAQSESENTSIARQDVGGFLKSNARCLVPAR